MAAVLCNIAAAQQDPLVETVSFASNALAQTETFTIVRPNELPGPQGYPVLIILHGLGRNQKTLLEQPETRELMLHQKALIVLRTQVAGGGSTRQRTGLNMTAC